MTLHYLTINHLEKPAGCFNNLSINGLYQHAPLLVLRQQRLNDGKQQNHFSFSARIKYTFTLFCGTILKNL